MSQETNKIRPMSRTWDGAASSLPNALLTSARMALAIFSTKMGSWQWVEVKVELLADTLHSTALHCTVWLPAFVT